MSIPATLSRSAGASGRVLGTLAALATALAVAVVLAPPALAALGSDRDLADHHHHLVDSLRAAFVGYWRSGDRALSPT